MPIIIGLVKQDLEACARHEDHNAARVVHDRYPCLEFGVYLEGIALIVPAKGGGRACMDAQGIETARREGPVRPPHESLQMRFVKLIEIGFAHIDSCPLRRPKYAPGPAIAIAL